MSTISAAAAAISGPLQHQLSNGPNPASSQSNSNKPNKYQSSNSSDPNIDAKNQLNNNGSS